MSEENNLDHPCKDTCSGWKQGFERGEDKWRGIAEELAEALKSAKGWVVTHAMQTYNKRADQEAYEINILLQKFEQAVKGEK